MNDELKAKWNEADRTGEKVAIGNIVVCDYCDEDFTNNPVKGGFIFGSYACCPYCEDRMLANIRKHHEENYIKGRCPGDMSFADFVRAYRGDNNYIQIRK